MKSPFTMKTKLFLITFVSILSTQLGLAQDNAPKDDWKPSAANRPGQQYPRINSERRAQIRITAPDAKDVSVTLGRPLTVTKGDDGVWTITTSPLDVGFHFYRVLIDGANVTDPATEIFCGGGGGGLSSAVEVPTGEDFYELKDVPHGEVRERRYFSKTTQAWRRIFVYTPPDYDRKTSTRYPVLYLQHGGGEDERGWPVQGRVCQIMDNLIAEKKAQPMLIVMENGGNVGGGRGRGAQPGGAPAGAGAAPAATGATNAAPARGGRGGFGGGFNFGALERVFIDDLIPMIDQTYRTKADRAHRAMAGLSMGGMQTRSIALPHLDTFSHIGVFSGGSIATNDITNVTDLGTFKKKVKLVFVSYGSRELGGGARGGGRRGGPPEGATNAVSVAAGAATPAGAPGAGPARGGGRGGFGGDPKANVEALKQAGINAVFYVSPETAHEWHTWRRSLHQFAQLLFKN